MIFADLAVESIPPEENAITFLRRVRPQVSAICAELEDTFGDDSPDRENGKLTAAGAAKVRATLEAYENVVPTLTLAAACPEYDPMHDYSVSRSRMLEEVFDQASHSRGPSRVLMLQADLQIFDGELDEALQTCIHALHYGKHLEREPFIIGYLISLAVRDAALLKINEILATGTIAAKSHALLTAELELNDSMQGFPNALKSERVLGIASLREMFPGKLPLWYVRNWESDYLDMMATEVKMGASPRFEIADQIQAQQTAMTSGTTLANNVYAAISAARDAIDRVRARGRCIYVISAFQQSAEDGANDELELDRLGLDRKYTIDPFSGKPLRTKRTPEGWIVYSVGHDGKDDGGNFKDPNVDAGAGPVRTGT